LAISDFLDGFLARKFNQESSIGTILDPLADKICLGSILIYFAIKKWWPLWIIVTIFARDIVQILFFIIFFNKMKFSIAVSWISKINTAIIFFTILFFLLASKSCFFSYANLCWSMIAFLTIWSGVDYGRKFFSSLRSL
jgi:cardiolipin synthase